MPKPRNQITSTVRDVDLEQYDHYAQTEDVSRAEAIRALSRLGYKQWLRSQPK